MEILTHRDNVRGIAEGGELSSQPHAGGASLSPDRSKVALWFRRGLFSVALGILAWQMLLRVAPAHPVETSPAGLVLAIVCVCVSGALLFSNAFARRTLSLLFVMNRYTTSPMPYVVWTLLVSAALYGTYFSDPYVFGFTTLGLAWLTGAIAVLGLGACLFSTPGPRDRVIIVVALVLSGAALARALAVLSTFKWA